MWEGHSLTNLKGMWRTFIPTGVGFTSAQSDSDVRYRGTRTRNTNHDPQLVLCPDFTNFAPRCTRLLELCEATTLLVSREHRTAAVA